VKIYVASATANVDAVEELIAYIKEETEHSITFDWTEGFRANGRERLDFDDHMIEQAANADAIGVAVADLVILLWHPEVYGAMAEFGMACVHGKKLWVVSNQRVKFSVFFRMPGNYAHMLSEHQALSALKPGHSWVLVSEQDPAETEVCLYCGAQRDRDGLLAERAGITHGWCLEPHQCEAPATVGPIGVAAHAAQAGEPVRVLTSGMATPMVGDRWCARCNVFGHFTNDCPVAS
jgi:hypothetical protein